MMAATIRAESVEAFIDQMCQLAATVDAEERKQPGVKYTSKQPEQEKVLVCKKKETITRIARIQWCFYRKVKGQRSFECTKLKKKSQTAAVDGTDGSSRGRPEY